MLARVAAVLAGVVAARLAYVMVASAAEAVALVILAACVPAAWGTWRMVAYGSLRKPRPVTVSAAGRQNMALPAPPQMLEAARVPVPVVLARDEEMIR
jgi:hypothetical protein